MVIIRVPEKEKVAHMRRAPSWVKPSVKSASCLQVRLVKAESLRDRRIVNVELAKFTSNVPGKWFTDGRQELVDRRIPRVVSNLPNLCSAQEQSLLETERRC